MEKKTKNTQDDDVLNATAEQSTSQKKEERIIVVDEPQAEGERSLPSQATLLRNVGVLIKEIDKKLNPGGSKSDTYNAALKSIKGLTTRDYTNVVEQEKQELLAEARVNDAEKDNITVKPPLHFGTEDFTDSEERHLRQWRQGITNKSHDPALPSIESVLAKMTDYHRKNGGKFSESAWREQLLLLVSLDCKKDMQYYSTQEMKARDYFPYLLAVHQSELSRAQAKGMLQKAVLDMNADYLTTLEKIRDLSKIIEPNPCEYLSYALQESDRYLRAFCGPSAAAMIKIAFNQRSIKNFQTYIEESRDFTDDIAEGNRRLHKQEKKKTGKVYNDDDSSEGFVGQTTATYCQATRAQHFPMPPQPQVIPLYDETGTFRGYFQPPMCTCGVNIPPQHPDPQQSRSQIEGPAPSTGQVSTSTTTTT